MKKQALIIVGKAPVAGEVKTRLSPPLTPEQGALLYEQFLLDTVAMAEAVEETDAVLLYVPRPGAAERLKRVLPGGVRLLGQMGVGLGEGSAFAFRTLLGEGYAKVVLVGSDNPNLPPSILRQAYAALDQADLVFGPTFDGGYYAIGMRAPHLGVFERIHWSTELVEGEIRERAAELGLSIHELARWYDIDSAAELRRLIEDLAASDDPALAPHTRRLLAGWTQAGWDPAG